MTENIKKKGRGRPPFDPSKEQRTTVELMASIGVPQEAIAAAIGIAEKTLREHFRAELDTGKVKTITRVADSLVRQALAGNVTAMIFYLKTQAGWKETERHEVSNTVVIKDISAEPLADDEWAARYDEKQTDN